MDTIKDIWFDANRIYMKTDGGETFSRPLEAFPLLKDASDRERLDFKIGKFGDDVRWESLDEDIHICNSLINIVQFFAHIFGKIVDHLGIILVGPLQQGELRTDFRKFYGNYMLIGQIISHGNKCPHNLYVHIDCDRTA